MICRPLLPVCRRRWASAKLLRMRICYRGKVNIIIAAVDIEPLCHYQYLHDNTGHPVARGGSAKWSQDVDKRKLSIAKLVRLIYDDGLQIHCPAVNKRAANKQLHNMMISRTVFLISKWTETIARRSETTMVTKGTPMKDSHVIHI